MKDRYALIMGRPVGVVIGQFPTISEAIDYLYIHVRKVGDDGTEYMVSDRKTSIPVRTFSCAETRCV